MGQWTSNIGGWEVYLHIHSIFINGYSHKCGRTLRIDCLRYIPLLLLKFTEYQI